MEQVIKQNWLEREFSKEAIEIISKYAPFLTPLAPAAVAVGGMTYSLTIAYGGWAFLPALGSGLGMEATGYLSSHLLIRAIRRGDFWSALLALCFLLGYAGFAIAAMSTMRNAATFQYFVAMSVVTYLCVALYVFDNKQAKAADEKRMREIEDRRAALQIEKEEAALHIETEKAHAEIENNRLKWEAQVEHERTLQSNADVRRAKAEQGKPVQSVQSVRHRTSVQALRPDWLQKTRDYLAVKPDATTREISAMLGASSPSTGKTYRDAAK